MLKKIAATAALALAATGMASSAAQAAPLVAKDVVYEDQRGAGAPRARPGEDGPALPGRAGSSACRSSRTTPTRTASTSSSSASTSSTARKGFRVLRFVVEPQHNQARVDLEVKRKNTKKYREAHFIARDALNTFVRTRIPEQP